MNQLSRFTPAIIFTLFCLVLAVVYALNSGKALPAVLGLVITLGILEISLSFDNAVVNASVLEDMEEKWQRYFLTWGILIAVFGMRLVFPILIVALTAMLGPFEVLRIALEKPEEYASILAMSHVEVSAFGGMFLLLVFLTFLFDGGKTVHWFETLEVRLVEVGKLDSVEIIIALAILLVSQWFLPDSDQVGALTYGILGVMLFVFVDSLSSMISLESAESVKRNGALGFLYLEILDASFSFDGVLGAFAITTDIVIIMLGLAIGAMFVRNLTVMLVQQGTLHKYTFLEHGAHYAIGALALIMLAKMTVHVPEVITGLAGITIIAFSIYSSLRKRRNILDQQSGS